jgi:hypothetical protein
MRRWVQALTVPAEGGVRVGGGALRPGARCRRAAHAQLARGVEGRARQRAGPLEGGGRAGLQPDVGEGEAVPGVGHHVWTEGGGGGA